MLLLILYDRRPITLWQDLSLYTLDVLCNVSAAENNYNLCPPTRRQIYLSVMIISSDVWKTVPSALDGLLRKHQLSFSPWRQSAMLVSLWLRLWLCLCLWLVSLFCFPLCASWKKEDFSYYLKRLNGGARSTLHTTKQKIIIILSAGFGSRSWGCRRTRLIIMVHLGPYRSGLPAYLYYVHHLGGKISSAAPCNLGCEDYSC